MSYAKIYLLHLELINSISLGNTQSLQIMATKMSVVVDAFFVWLKIPCKGFTVSLYASRLEFSPGWHSISRELASHLEMYL